MKQLDIFISILIFTSGLFASYFSIHAVSRLHDTKTVLLKDTIIEGKRIFEIYSFKKCVGHLRIRLHTDHSSSLESRGLIRASYKNQYIATALKMSASFNPLGQLSDASLNISTNELSLDLRSSGTNPLKIQTFTSGFPKDIHFEHDLKGPIVLSEYSHGHYQLEVPEALNLSQPVVTGAAQQLIDSMGLKLLELPGEMQPCESRELESLDLTGIIEQTKPFALNSFGLSLFSESKDD